MKTAYLVVWMLLASIGAEAQAKKCPLCGSVVVIDPGHGGSDPGASRRLKGVRVIENEYVYDVSLRVARLIREKQGLAFLTIRDEDPVRSGPASAIFIDRRNERFALDNTVVKAGASGLARRVAYGNMISRKYPDHKQAWISIHFDVVPSSKIFGVRVITSNDSSRFTKSLEKSFDISRRLRDVAPIVESGDREHGIRHLYVLGSTNLIKEKVLIELGNFRNDIDLWRIRDPKVRELYAAAIVRALEHY